MSLKNCAFVLWLPVVLLSGCTDHGATQPTAAAVQAELNERLRAAILTEPVSLAAIDAALKAGAEVNEVTGFEFSPLDLGARSGHAEVVELLLKAGADVNAKGVGWTALDMAASEGHLDVVVLLIRSGGEVNVKDLLGSTPLHRAARGGHAEVVIALLAAGAEVNARDS